MKKLKKGVKKFFSSIWEDFVALLKKHWLRLIGYIICFPVPIIVLLTLYVSKVENATKFVVPFVIIIPLTILVFIYWGKAKSYFKAKFIEMKVQNSIEAGKHAGIIIVFEIVNVFMTVLPFLLCYWFISELQKYYAEVSNIFLFIVICESIGGLFIVLDTIKNVLTFEEIKEQEKESDNK